MPTKTDIRGYNYRGQLHEVFVITEMRDGCVFRTKAIGYVVCRSNAPCLKPAAKLTAISTNASQHLEFFGTLWEDE
jgi:hypothetical protein